MSTLVEASGNPLDGMSLKATLAAALVLLVLPAWRIWMLRYTLKAEKESMAASKLESQRRASKGGGLVASAPSADGGH